MNDETRKRVRDAALKVTTTAWRRRFADPSITPTYFEWRDMALEVGEAAHSEGYQAGMEAAAKRVDEMVDVQARSETGLLVNNWFERVAAAIRAQANKEQA